MIEFESPRGAKVRIHWKAMRILVAIEPVDLRKGIDGLAQFCREKLAQILLADRKPADRDVPSSTGKPILKKGGWV